MSSSAQVVAAGTVSVQTSKDRFTHSIPLALFLRFLFEVCILSILSYILKVLYWSVVPRADHVQHPSKSPREEAHLGSSLSSRSGISDSLARHIPSVTSMPPSASRVHGLDRFDLVHSAAMAFFSNDGPSPPSESSTGTFKDSSSSASPTNTSNPSAEMSLSLASTHSSASDKCKYQAQLKDEEDEGQHNTNDTRGPKLSKAARRRRNRRIRLAPYLGKPPSFEAEAKPVGIPAPSLQLGDVAP
ncbi:hypothetical protein K488DRAFT_86738 [Vararia minispora EC-137]|uniref:Uncharacterized protein n=1 Tax=Vararia minispora EC-137 TaxID=1314806 RepID=A0ACB8QJL0_9AGAM|nr:hypothetical protein K488DRAFT_86738 [Vararia minispora EC-137]